MIDYLHEQEENETLVDEILENEDTFSMCARSYARAYGSLIPTESFLTYSVRLLTNLRTAQHTNAWRCDNAIS